MKKSNYYFITILIALMICGAWGGGFSGGFLFGFSLALLILILLGYRSAKASGERIDKVIEDNRRLKKLNDYE